MIGQELRSEVVKNEQDVENVLKVDCCKVGAIKDDEEDWWACLGAAVLSDTDAVAKG